jgi:hypothetical protein
VKDSNDHLLNWVERKHLAEGHLQDERDVLWRDTCAALEDASRSFNKLYQGESDTEAINGHRFRITYSHPQSKQRCDIDVDFNEANSTIRVTYPKSNRRSCLFGIEADHMSAFITDEKRNRLSPDEVSQQILKDLLFPSPPREVWQRGRLN